MPDLTATLDSLVIGDDYDVQRTVTGVPAGTTLTDAWLTLKLSEGDADPGVIQKHITTSLVAGVGHIDDDGADQTGHVIFQLTNSDTGALTHRRYHYDIQVKTASGKIYTVEKGTALPVTQITTSTS